MTHDERFPDSDFEDEPIEVVVAEKPGVILELRFSGDEIREIGDESRLTGLRADRLVREYTLATIRAKAATRERLARLRWPISGPPIPRSA